MSNQTVIEAVASVIPSLRISSSWIEEQLDKVFNQLEIPKGQIETLTGIKERRLWEPGFPPSEAATMAARKAIAQADIDPQEIGIIINTSVCKDYIEPSVASLVHGNLQLSSHCINYDIGNACLGFINAMHTIKLMIETGQVKYGLIVDGESSREVLEATIERLKNSEASLKTLHKNFATLTLGSGAAAMILSGESGSKNAHVLNGGVSLAATEYNRLCLGHPTQMVTDTNSLLKNGVALAHKTWQLASEEIPYWNDDSIDHYIPHQVSARYTEVLNQQLGISTYKNHLTFPDLGNIGPAAIPITLSSASEAGDLRPDDHVVLLGIGSGLNCSMMSITW